MGICLSKVHGVDEFSSLHYLEDSRHVMLNRSREKKQQEKHPPFTNEPPSEERAVNVNHLTPILRLTAPIIEPRNS